MGEQLGLEAWATQPKISGPDVNQNDLVRLGRQASAVFRTMRPGHWRTLAEIEAITGFPPASVSARLRDFRKEMFGSHDVRRRRRFGGLWEYSLIPNRCAQLELWKGAAND